MSKVQIAPSSEGKKARTFRAGMFGIAMADALWEGGETGGDNVRRPVFVVFAGSDQEIRPFVANAVSGRKIDIVKDQYSRHNERVELLKSARYELAWQRGPAGTTATAFMPDLLHIDPGMVDPAGARFVMLPRAEWLRVQDVGDARRAAKHALAALATPVDRLVRKEELPDLDSLASLLPAAHLFAVYLDRRTRCPIYADGRFYLQLLGASFLKGYASLARPRTGYYDRGFGHANDRCRFTADGLDQLGVEHAVAFKATHEEVEEMLAAQTEIFFQLRKEAA